MPCPATCRSLWLGGMLLVAAVYPPQSRCEAESATPDDGWRRTAEGWEYWPLGATAKPLLVTPETVEPPFPGAAHPAAWAGLQLALSVFVLATLSRPEE